MTQKSKRKTIFFRTVNFCTLIQLARPESHSVLPRLKVAHISAHCEGYSAQRRGHPANNDAAPRRAQREALCGNLDDTKFDIQCLRAYILYTK